MNKKAIQLSVNFIVMLIISIIIFSMGIYFAKRIFSRGEELRLIFDERTEAEIARLLDDGSKVAIPFTKKTIHNGGFDTFGIGILNTIDFEKFNLHVYFNKAYDLNGNLLCDKTNPDDCKNPQNWLKASEGTTTSYGIVITTEIPKYHQKKFLVGIDVDKNAPKGVYIFDVNVTYEDSAVSKWKDYDSIHKLYVEVP